MPCLLPQILKFKAVAAVFVTMLFSLQFLLLRHGFKCSADTVYVKAAFVHGGNFPVDGSNKNRACASFRLCVQRGTCGLWSVSCTAAWPFKTTVHEANKGCVQNKPSLRAKQPFTCIVPPWMSFHMQASLSSSTGLITLLVHIIQVWSHWHWADASRRCQYSRPWLLCGCATLCPDMQSHLISSCFLSIQFKLH